MEKTEKMEMGQPAATNVTDQDREPDRRISRIIRESKEGNVEELRRALDAEPGEVDTPDGNGLSPLFFAVKKGSLPCVKLLFSKNANVNMAMEMNQPAATNSKDEDQDYELSLSPFLLACKLGLQSIVEFLFYNMKSADLCQTRVKGHLNCLSLAIMNSHEETVKFLVTHTTYDTLLFLMKTVSPDLTLGRHSTVSPDLTLGRHSERMSTPMRQLIQYMPGVAEIVMDRCITLNEKDDEVTCYVELLDDSYSPWARQNEDHSEVFGLDGNLLVDPEPRHTPIKNSQHPLALMQGQELHANLLTHPLSIKLIEHKWRTLGSAVNSVSLAVYLFFLAFLTGYVLVNPPSFYVKFFNKTDIIWYYEPDKLLPDKTYSEAAKYFFGGNSTGILLVLVILNITKEIFQMYSQRRSYLDYQRLLEWSIYVLTFFLVIPVSGVQYEEYTLREIWQWQCGALAIFLAWINLALYVRQTSALGIYVIMFEDVLRSTVQFLAVMLLFLIAFALAFNTLLLNQTDFHSFGESFLRTIAMTTGELEFSQIFHSQNYLGTENVSPEEDFILTAVFSYLITRITFVVFVLTMPIIAMNLLVGVAVDDIHRIRQKATFYYMKLKVDRVISAENMALGTPLSKYIIRRLPITVQSLKIQLSRRSKLKIKNWRLSLTRFRTWFTSVVDFEQLQESVWAVCKRNRERQKLCDQKSSCSHEDQPDGLADQTLLQKLCQMRDQIRDEINGLISQVEHRSDSRC